jgi:hypothetical protein
MKNQLTGRRELLLRVLPACSLCFGLSRLVVADAAQKSSLLPLANRAAEKTDMSYEALFQFSYGSMIPVWKHLSGQIGKDKFIEMLKKAVDEASVKDVESFTKNKPKRDLATYMESLKKPDPLYQHALTLEFVKDTEREAEVRFTECLWARTFRQANAADIGYALACYGDIPFLKAYNPKITLNRPKVLMHGDSECRFQWVVKT